MVKNQNKYNALIEVHKDLFKELMEAKDCCFNKCFVFDKLNVKRCFKCWGFNHNSKDCTNKIQCPKCSGDHSEDKCGSAKLECVNCLKAIARLNLDLDAGHDTRNNCCPVYQRRLEKERQRVAY